MFLFMSESGSENVDDFFPRVRSTQSLYCICVVVIIMLYLRSSKYLKISSNPVKSCFFKFQRKSNTFEHCQVQFNTFKYRIRSCSEMRVSQ